MPTDIIDIRPLRMPEDTPGLLRLDTSFETDHIYEIVARPDDPRAPSFALVTRSLAKPLRKTFPLDDLTKADRAWTDGLVAEHAGRIVGFIAWSVDRWNCRLTVWHFYLSAAYRRRGIGRRLMDELVEVAHADGLSRLWVETSNLNYPGLAAYARLGFEICGFDLTLYDGTASAGEQALFLSRSLA